MMEPFSILMPTQMQPFLMEELVSLMEQLEQTTLLPSMLMSILMVDYWTWVQDHIQEAYLYTVSHFLIFFYMIIVITNTIIVGNLFVGNYGSIVMAANITTGDAYALHRKLFISCFFSQLTTSFSGRKR